VACHPLIAHNGRSRRRLLGSAAQLPDEFRLMRSSRARYRVCTVPGSLRRWRTTSDRCCWHNIDC